LRLDQAQFVAGSAGLPPASGWMPVQLPDNWRKTHPTLDGYAWYRLRFELPAPPDVPLVLYVPHVSVAAEFWLNGSLLNPDVRYDTESGLGTSMADTAIHLVLPSGLFRSGTNTLDIRLQGSTRVRSGISAITIARSEYVRPAWQLRYALQSGAPYALLVIMCMAMFFMFAHFQRQRRKHGMQAVVLIAVVAATLYFVQGIPLSRGMQEVARIVVTTLMYWPMCIAGYRLAGYTLRGFLTALHVVTAVTLLGVIGSAMVFQAGDALWSWNWPNMVPRFIVAALILRRAWEDRSIKLGALGITTLLWLLALVQSGLNMEDLLDWDSFRWSVVGSLPFCVVMTFIFAERFVLDREEAAVAQRMAILNERERLLQDVHDGMGAQLVTALHIARQPDADRSEVVQSLEESLQDLRLIIDSMDMQTPDLLPLLANLRFRMEPHLKAMGISLEWDVQPLPASAGLRPEAALSVLRIVQEAINNAIRHGQARVLRVSVINEAGAAVISVTDDGRGFEVSADERQGAYGVRGMRQRAQKLGGTLTIDSGAGGTRVSLRFAY
jgi:signal transduction histidine kinase